MSDERAFHRPGMYQIRVKGVLDSGWSAWFDGLTVASQPDGETLLAGLVADQAALHSLLAKIRNVGLTLVSVMRVEDGDLGQP